MSPVKTCVSLLSAVTATQPQKQAKLQRSASAKSYRHFAVKSVELKKTNLVTPNIPGEFLKNPLTSALKQLVFVLRVKNDVKMGFSVSQCEFRVSAANSLSAFPDELMTAENQNTPDHLQPQQRRLKSYFLNKLSLL